MRALGWCALALALGAALTAMMVAVSPGMWLAVAGALL